MERSVWTGLMQQARQLATVMRWSSLIRSSLQARCRAGRSGKDHPSG